MGSHFWFSETEDASHLEIGSESEVRRIPQEPSRKKPPLERFLRLIRKYGRVEAYAY